jgi:hypothetical protein
MLLISELNHRDHSNKSRINVLPYIGETCTSIIEDFGTERPEGKPELAVSGSSV